MTFIMVTLLPFVSFVVVSIALSIPFVASRDVHFQRS